MAAKTFDEVYLVNYSSYDDVNLYEVGCQKCDPSYGYGPIIRKLYILHYVVFANIYTMNIQMSRHWNTHIFIKFTERFFICQPPLLIILVVSAGIFIKI